MTIQEHASAKINLALHVVGQRADGYHLLDTLVTFAEAGDRLSFTPSDRDGFAISGRFAQGLPVDATGGQGNLVLRARDLLRTYAVERGLALSAVEIHLEKNLPIASGIGGGSADAAATLRGLARLWNLAISSDELASMALALGADVPMCLQSKPLIARGIGEEIRLLAGFPSFHMLLVNPLVEVSTPAIFKSLTNKHNPPLALPADREPEVRWIEALAEARNDLQYQAEALEPKITETLAQLRQTGPILTRMSWSGATCFGLYADRAACSSARAALEAHRPEWYVEQTATR